MERRFLNILLICGSQLTVSAELPPLSITTSLLPNGMVGATNTQSLTATGGAPPYALSIASGQPPGALVISGSAITGTPSTPGLSNFTVQVTDNAGQIAAQALRILITFVCQANPGSICAPGTADDSFSIRFRREIDWHRLAETAPLTAGEHLQEISYSDT
jgi:hypothetical protein